MNPWEFLNSDSGSQVEADPGKDLFALLFLSFLLICVVLLMAAQARISELELSLNLPAVSRSAPPVPAARLQKQEGRLLLRQASQSWRVPRDVAQVRQQARFRQKTGSVRLLPVVAPGEEISAGELIAVVAHLRAAGVQLVFQAGVAP